MHDRYECIQEPADTWLVWDLLEDEPAVVDDSLLMSLTQVEAQWLCTVLNNRHHEQALRSAMPVGASLHQR